MKYVTDTEIGNIDCITLTKLCDKVNVGKALDICSRNFLRDRLVPKLHCLDRKPWFIFFGVIYSTPVHLRPESDELYTRMAVALVFEIALLLDVDYTVKAGLIVVKHIPNVERKPQQRTVHDYVKNVLDKNLDKEKVCVNVKHAIFIFHCVFDERVGVHNQLV